MKKMKTWKNEAKWSKMKKIKKFGFKRKILNDFQGLPLWLSLFFVEILDDFHDFVSECVSFHRKINNNFGSHRFSEEKWQFSLDVKQKHTFYIQISTTKKSLRSAPLSIIILLEKNIQQQQQ